MIGRLRKILKAIGWTVTAVFTLLVAFMVLLAFPGFMFAHDKKHANLTAYSDEDLSADIEPLLKQIQSRLETSTIDAPATEHRIFFGRDKRVFGFLQDTRAALVERALGMKPSLTYNASWPPAVSHVITFRVPDLKRGKLLSDRWPLAQDAAYLLTHEITHSLILERIGLSRTSALPLWKAEGYSDYVAAASIRRTPGYSLRAGVERLLRTDLRGLIDVSGQLLSPRYDCAGRSYVQIETGDSWNTCYYLSRLLVEYQLDVRGSSFDALMDPRVRDVDTWRDLRAAYDSGDL